MAAPSLLSPTTLAIVAGIGATIAAAFVVAHRVRRGRRTRARESERNLARQFEEVVGGRTSASQVWLAVRDADPASFWTALETFSIGLGRADRARLSQALARNPHSRAERRALEDDSPWRRELAARRLGLLGSSASRRALRTALQRGPELVTLAAARSLAVDRDREALRWLLDHPRALKRRSHEARAGLFRAFGRAALPDLLAALEHDPADPEVERVLIECLGAGRHAAAAETIMQRIAHPDHEIRIAAARALGRLGAERCSGSLVAALDDPEWAVRAQAARALGRMQAASAVWALASRLTDRSWWVRRHAAHALGRLGAEGRAALRRAAEASADPYARDMAREALERADRRREG